MRLRKRNRIRSGKKRDINDTKSSKISSKKEEKKKSSDDKPSASSSNIANEIKRIKSENRKEKIEEDNYYIIKSSSGSGEDNDMDIETASENEKKILLNEKCDSINDWNKKKVEDQINKKHRSISESTKDTISNLNITSSNKKIKEERFDFDFPHITQIIDENDKEKDKKSDLQRENIEFNTVIDLPSFTIETNQSFQQQKVEKIKFFNIKLIIFELFNLTQMQFADNVKQERDELLLFSKDRDYRTFQVEDEFEIDPSLLEESENYKKNCDLCYSKMKNYLIFFNNNYVFLFVSEKEPLIDGQFSIRSRLHYSSLASSSEDCIEKIQNYKEELCKVFENKLQKKLVFIELYFKSITSKNHVDIACYPVAKEKLEDLKIFFGKGIKKVNNNLSKEEIEKNLIKIDNKRPINEQVCSNLILLK